jgi:CRP-like cAMP-binding protein
MNRALLCRPTARVRRHGNTSYTTKAGPACGWLRSKSSFCYRAHEAGAFVAGKKPIFHHGRIAGLYFIVSGEVEVRVDGRTVSYGPGEFFGEIALVAGGRRTGMAVAKHPCMLLVLDIADFHELARHQPELSRAIRSKAAIRLERSKTGRDDIH